MIKPQLTSYNQALIDYNQSPSSNLDHSNPISDLES